MHQTLEDVQTEIEMLKTMKPTVRHYGMAGDNRCAIDAQIAVLRDNLSESQIYQNWPGEDEEDGDQYILDSALEAHRWRTGQSNVAPHEDWQSLVEE